MKEACLLSIYFSFLVFRLLLHGKLSCDSKATQSHRVSTHVSNQSKPHKLSRPFLFLKIQQQNFILHITAEFSSLECWVCVNKNNVSVCIVGHSKHNVLLYGHRQNSVAAVVNVLPCQNTKFKHGSVYMVLGVKTNERNRPFQNTGFVQLTE